MQYTILETMSVHSLEAKVNAHLQEGWALHGGICLAKDYGVTTYAQAMIKDVRVKSPAMQQMLREL